MKIIFIFIVLGSFISLNIDAYDLGNREKNQSSQDQQKKMKIRYDKKHKNRYPKK